MYDTLYAILNNSENATLQCCKKALDEKYLLKFNNVFEASRKRFVEDPLSRLMSELIPFLCLKLYSLNFAIAHAQTIVLFLSEFVILVLH